jgi:DNA-binding NarL/FixJ family response regulator
VVLLRERRERLQAILKILSPRRRWLIALIVQGLGVGEIAVRINIQLKSVSPIQNRLVRPLRCTALFAADCREPPLEPASLGGFRVSVRRIAADTHCCRKWYE